MALPRSMRLLNVLRSGSGGETRLLIVVLATCSIGPVESILLYLTFFAPASAACAFLEQRKRNYRDDGGVAVPWKIVESLLLNTKGKPHRVRNRGALHAIR